MDLLEKTLDRLEVVLESFGEDVREVLAVVGEQCDRLLGIKAEVLGYDYYKQLQQGFG